MFIRRQHFYTFGNIVYRAMVATTLYVGRSGTLMVSREAALPKGNLYLWACKSKSRPGK